MFFTSPIAHTCDNTLQNVGGTVAKFATVQTEGGRRVVRMVEHYGLEMIASVGFSVKSPEGVVFRRWANRVLVDMMLQGVSVGRKYEALALEMDRRLSKHDADIVELRKDVDFFISSLLPPKEKVFVGGKMLDAQVELTRIVKTAKSRWHSRGFPPTQFAPRILRRNDGDAKADGSSGHPPFFRTQINETTVNKG